MTPTTLSEKQLTANQRNAEHSTGPRTAVGKRRSAGNALKHGLSASTTILLPDEDPREFQQLGRTLRKELHPEGVLQETFFQRILSCLWRLQRIGRLEASILNFNMYRESQTRALGKGFGCFDHTKFIQPGGQLVDTSTFNEAGDVVVKSRMQMEQDATIAGQAYAADAAGPKTLAQLRRHEITLERSLYRAIYAFDALRHHRRSAPTNIPSLVAPPKSAE